MSTNSVGLSQAHYILREEEYRLISLSTDDLWRSYSLDDAILTGVKQHLIKTRWLSEQGKWDSICGEEIDRNKFAVLGEDGSEVESFAFFSHLFNTVLEYLRRRGHGAPVKRVVYAGAVRSGSTGATSHQPDAFLQLNTGASPTPGKFKWRDLVCPFEYKLGDGYPLNNDTKTLRGLCRILRCDPCRIFSFGATVYGTALRIWLLSRMAPFMFTPFDWFEDPESLLKLFVILATSSEADLGFDKGIGRRVGGSDFDLIFTIQGTIYHTSRLLYDLGADAATGRGTRAFEAVDRKSKEVRVIKDCWIEDRSGKLLEHDVVAMVKHDIAAGIKGDIVAGVKHDVPEGIKHDAGDFHKHFIDICGYQRTDKFGRFDNICEILKAGTFIKHQFEPQLLVSTTGAQKVYLESAKDGIADEDTFLQPAQREPPPVTPPHPRFRYQVVYSERGKSLFEVTLFSDAFTYLAQAADALHYLHKVGWVHRDFTPGNIIVVETTAKISDFEFAKRREAHQLEELTKSTGTSSRVVKDSCVGTLPFMSIEVEEGEYLFLPEVLPDLEDNDDEMDDDGLPEGDEDGIQSPVGPPKRTFLHNPLHDYESVWWIAVWLLFCCKPEGVADGVMEQAHDRVYKNRLKTFQARVFENICGSLPVVLRPLSKVLAEMRNTLVVAYRLFESTFDGSRMLLVFQKLKKSLLRLEKRAQGLAVKPSIQNLRLNIEGVGQFDAVVLGEEQGWEGRSVAEHKERVGEQSTCIDEPPISARQQDSALGKRPADSPSKANRVLKPRTNQR